MPELERRPDEPYATRRVEVGGRAVGTWRLPREQITVGRASGAAVHLPFERVPRLLATVVPYSTTPNFLAHSQTAHEGWILINGERTRAKAENRRASVEAKPSGVVALQQGTTRVIWPELDEAVTVVITVGDRGADPVLPVARDRAPDERAVAVQGTLMALQRSDVRPGLRHSMAVLFVYLLDGTPRPANVYKSAAQELRTTEAGVKRSAERLMGRINEHRFGDGIETLDQLGHYLVTTAALITTDDLQGGAGR